MHANAAMLKNRTKLDLIWENIGESSYGTMGEKGTRRSRAANRFRVFSPVVHAI